MSFRTCCVQNCFVRLGQGVPLHCFPNPMTEQERYQAWLRQIGGEVATLEQSCVFKNRRICHKHFNPIYYNSKNRLSKIAVPSISVLDDQLTISHGPPMHSHNPPLQSLVPGGSVSSSNDVPVETTAIPDIANTHSSASLSKVTPLPKHVTSAARARRSGKFQEPLHSMTPVWWSVLKRCYPAEVYVRSMVRAGKHAPRKCVDVLLHGGRLGIPMNAVVSDVSRSSYNQAQALVLLNL